MHVPAGATAALFRERIRARDAGELLAHGAPWAPDEDRGHARPRRPTVGVHKGRRIETAVVLGRWRR